MATTTQGGRRHRPPVPRWSGANAYSNFVALLKVTLPVVAVCLVGLIVFWRDLVPNPKLIAPGISDLSADLAQNLAMVNPRYNGVDELGRPYTVTADSASQKGANENIIELERPTADITLENGAWIALSAERGRYNRKLERLLLADNVNFFHDQGFELRSPFAELDLRRSEARGNRGVEGQGPQGALEAEGFEFLEEGNVIIFTGKSHLTVYPQEDDGMLGGSTQDPS